MVLFLGFLFVVRKRDAREREDERPSVFGHIENRIPCWDVETRQHARSIISSESEYSIIFSAARLMEKIGLL